MASTPSGLIVHCKKALANDVQYVYGAKMEVLTYSQILALQNTYGKSYVWDSDLNKAGKICCDCSGLISSYTGVTRNSSNYASTASATATIAQVKANWSKYVGWAFWLSGHIGVVSDTEGYYYAMDGSAANMVHKPISNQNWTKALKLCDIDYTATNTTTTTTKEDDEVVDTTQISINGTTYTVNRILKDGKNYICLADFNGKGFDIGYNSSTKIPSIDNTIEEIDVTVNGEKKKISAVNISGFNFSKIRELVEAMDDYEIDYKDNTVIITTAE